MRSAAQLQWEAHSASQTEHLEKRLLDLRAQNMQRGATHMDDEHAVPHADSAWSRSVSQHSASELIPYPESVGTFTVSSVGRACVPRGL